MQIRKTHTPAGKFLAIVMALALIIGLLPGMMLTAAASDDDLVINGGGNSNSAGSATATVTWTADDIIKDNIEGNVLTKDGVSFESAKSGALGVNEKSFYAGGTFTTALGKFAKIEVAATESLSDIGKTSVWNESTEDYEIEMISGWTSNGTNATWEGEASDKVEVSVVEGIVKITFTIFTTDTSDDNPPSVSNDTLVGKTLVKGDAFTASGTVYARSKDEVWVPEITAAARISSDPSLSEGNRIAVKIENGNDFISFSFENTDNLTADEIEAKYVGIKCISGTGAEDDPYIFELAEKSMPAQDPVASVSKGLNKPELFTDFAEAVEAWEENTILTLLDDVETDIYDRTEGAIIDVSKMLDLGGHTLTYKHGYSTLLFRVDKGAQFILDDSSEGDGQIVSKLTAPGSTCVEVINGELVMRGGIIKDFSGCGVELSEYNGNSGEFSMSGGMITNCAKGVQYWNGGFGISGDATVTGNGEGETKRNVEMVPEKLIEIDSEFSGEIGVTFRGDYSGIFTEDWSFEMPDGADPADYFTSDSPDYKVILKEGEAALAKPYSITIAETENGEVVAKVDGKEVNAAYEGDEVTLTVTPDDGYQLEDGSLKVTTAGDMPELMEVPDLAELLKNATFTANPEFDFEFGKKAADGALACVNDSFVLAVVGNNGTTRYELPSKGVAYLDDDEENLEDGIAAIYESVLDSDDGESAQQWQFMVSKDSHKIVTIVVVGISMTEEDGPSLAFQYAASVSGGDPIVADGMDVDLDEDNTFIMPDADVTISASFVEPTKPKNPNEPTLPDEVAFENDLLEWYFTAAAGQEYTTTFEELENGTYVPDFSETVEIIEDKVTGSFRPGYPAVVFTRFEETDEYLPSDWANKGYVTPTATVTFVTNGGSAVAPLTGLVYGARPELPTPTRANYYFAGWYWDSDLKMPWNAESDFISEVSTTLYAKWSAIPLHEVVGRVLEHDGHTPISNAFVILMQGDAIIGYVQSDSQDGTFALSAAAGTYNLVVEYYPDPTDLDNSVTCTQLVKLSTATDLGNIIMPEVGRNSVLDNEDAGSFAATVGGLDDIVAAVDMSGYAPSATVTVTLSITAESNVAASDSMSVADKAEFTAGKTAIAALPETSGKTMSYLNLSLTMEVVQGVSSNTTDIGDDNDTLLTIVIPFDKSGKTNIAMYRYHGDTAEAIRTAANADGERIVLNDDGTLTLYAKKFSTYAIGYTVESNNGGNNGNNSGDNGGTYTGGGGSAVVVNPTPTLTPTPAPVETAAPSGFIDVPNDAWYHDDVYFLAERGIITGSDDDGTIFAPNDSLSRGMLVTMLYRLSGDEASQASGQPFTDVTDDAYYAAAVAWAYTNGIVNGYGDGLFGPEDTVTREQAVAILYRYAMLKGYDIAVGAEEEARKFEDYYTASPYALGSIEWAVEHGILRGRPDNTIDPLNGNTRAEVAALLARFIRGYDI